MLYSTVGIVLLPSSTIPGLLPNAERVSRMVTGSPSAIWLWYHPLLWWLPPIAQRSKTLGKVERIRFLAFEEGYLRPQFITVEEDGVNAYSSLPRDPDFYRKLPDMPTPHVENLKPSTMKRIGHAMWYYLMGWHYRHEFPRYRHHKSFSPGMKHVAGFVHTGASNFTR